jgi:hypothetical protein
MTSATVEITDTATFPVGTALAAYRKHPRAADQGWPGFPSPGQPAGDGYRWGAGSSAPPGSPVAVATIGNNGATFNLEAGQEWWVAGHVSGEWRYLAIRS